MLAVTLRTGLRRVPGRDMRQGIVRGLLVVVVAATLVQTGILVASLVSSDDLGISGPQLLQSGTTLWLSNVVAFGLAFWELDCGGPVERALSDRRHAPDFGFPQDDNPDLARPDWSPHLVHYLYLFDDQLHRVQPHGRHAAHPAGEGTDDGGVGGLGHRGAPHRRPRHQHPPGLMTGRAPVA